MIDEEPVDRLDRVLLALEDSVLSMSDREAVNEAGSDLDEVGLVIRRALGRTDSQPQTVERHVSRAPRRLRSAQSPRRRSVGARTAPSGSLLAQQVRMAFMSGDATNDEIAELLQKILSAPDEPSED